MINELWLLMDQHAPVRPKVKRCGKNDCRWLLPEARAAKQLRRRLERHYRWTSKASDTQAFATAAAEAYNSIRKSLSGTARRGSWRQACHLASSQPFTTQQAANVLQ